MKIFGYIINSVLILGIVLYLVIVGINATKPTVLSTDISTKKLKSSELLVEEKQMEHDLNKEVVEEVVTEEMIEDISLENEIDLDEQIVEEESLPIVSDVLESHVGAMSGYGPDCRGCSGFLASGKYVGDGNVTYYDSDYGNVRILAGDVSIPFGSIVRVKNSRVPEFLGIVLDRGGSIGFGKKFLFDLLYPSEDIALSDEVSYNTTFEILRFGY